MFQKIIFIIISIFILVLGYYAHISNTKEELGSIVFENKSSFVIEYARTTKEKRQGLSNREFLREGHGMLFIFEEEGIYPFWMKDTLIPLDIIWISENKEVVHIKRNALPSSYLKDPPDVFIPNSEALWVLETNSGELGNINIGDKIDSIN